jgi:two-component sensor histidine kinase
MSDQAQKEAANDSEQKGAKILEVIMSYARLDFTAKTEIGTKGDVFDAISAGVNMMGEELKSSTISLREKEQLLKEVHHRVKNNLQIISSLLNLQSQNISDKKFMAMVRESRNRIKSMALVHEMLYSTADLSHIKLREYFFMLYNNIYESYKSPELSVTLHAEIGHDIHFEIDRMIPLGLIFNEIISNSMKYAFNNNGVISIRVEQKAGKFIMDIGDNGKGFLPDFDPKTQASLGIQLIFMLAEQLDAQITLENRQGAFYSLTF